MPAGPALLQEQLSAVIKTRQVQIRAHLMLDFGADADTNIREQENSNIDIDIDIYNIN